MNPNNFVEWQKQCVCDFENNNNTHSQTCLSRFKNTVHSKGNESNEHCGECNHHLELEYDRQDCECGCHGEGKK